MSRNTKEKHAEKVRRQQFKKNAKTRKKSHARVRRSGRARADDLEVKLDAHLARLRELPRLVQLQLDVAIHDPARCPHFVALSEGRAPHSIEFEHGFEKCRTKFDNYTHPFTHVRKP